jgi:hypothetical protein
VKRRTFVFTGLAAVTAASSVLADTSGRPCRIGVLIPSAQQWEAAAFTEALRRLGYVQDQNLTLDVQSANGALDRLPALATALVAARPDVIVAVNTPGAKAAIEATKTIPIVMVVVGDPVGSGFAESLAHPGGNATGLSNLSGELAAKRLSVLKEVVPVARRVAILLNPNDPITVPLLDVLRAWWREGRRLGALLPGSWLFPGRNPIEPLSTRQLNRAIHAAAEAAGIKKRVSLHTLRHSFGARIGATAVLHSWGSAMTHHPHELPLGPSPCSAAKVARGQDRGVIPDEGRLRGQAVWKRPEIRALADSGMGVVALEIPRLGAWGVAMHRFIDGEDRMQRTLLANSLEDYVDAENPVRVIDVSSTSLTLPSWGFRGRRRQRRDDRPTILRRC